MATYNGWTEVREYRVMMAEEVYTTTTVERHRNGWFSVYTDGDDNETKTRSESFAFRDAQSRMDDMITEAEASCRCYKLDAEDQEECEDAAHNPYGSPHGVRGHVYDSIHGTEIESWNL